MGSEHKVDSRYDRRVKGPFLKMTLPICVSCIWFLFCFFVFEKLLEFIGSQIYGFFKIFFNSKLSNMPKKPIYVKQL